MLQKIGIMQRFSHNILHVCLYISLFTVSLSSCSQSKMELPKETIVKHIIMYDASGDTSKIGVNLKQKVWYSDSFAIEQICLFSVLDSSGIIKHTNRVDRYRFNDLRRKAIYEYRHLSDSASILNKYYLSDTTELINGWNFSVNRAGNLKYDSAITLSDTIIGAESYKRMRLYRTFSGMSITIDCEFNCNKKYTVFDFDPKLSSKVGCPLVTLVTRSGINHSLISIDKIEFVSNQFTDSISNVIKAWKENEKRYPINNK